MSALPPVGPLLREAARRFVLPRFRRPELQGVREKTPGDLVTLADTEAEAFLVPRLRALLPGMRVVGEEGYGPDDQGALDRGGAAVLLDPLDGTRAFTEGDPRFSMLVAVCEGGQPVMGWAYFPARDTLLAGHIQHGVWRDGARLARPSGGADRQRLRWLDPADQVRLGPLLDADGWQPDEPTSTEFSNLLDGTTRRYLCSHTTPWDTAPGVLLARAMGGHVERCDGPAWSAGDTAGMLLFAPDAETWSETVSAYRLDTLRPARSPLESA